MAAPSVALVVALVVVAIIIVPVVVLIVVVIISAILVIGVIWVGVIIATSKGSRQVRNYFQPEFGSDVGRGKTYDSS